MAETKITGLPPLDATPDGADIFEIVDDVVGTPTSKKITMANMRGGMAPLNSPALVTPDIGAATLSGAMSCADNLVVRPEIKDYAETVKVHGALSSATDADLEDGNVHTFTVDGAFTLTLVNPPANTKAGSITFIITNGGSSALTWDPDIDWPGGTAPNLTASGIDVVVCTTVDNGTTWFGFIAGLDVKT